VEDKLCLTCILPANFPGVTFNADGICNHCQSFKGIAILEEQKKQYEKQLLELVGRYGKKSEYDCLMCYSGGKDSTRQAMYVRDQLGLKPLLVCCAYPPEEITELGVDNISNLISLGFDCISVSPNPQAWKDMMREGFFRYGNLFKSTEMALYVSAPKIAIAYHIPLIFYGENPATAYGASEIGSENGDANRMKDANTLKGGPDSVLSDNVTEKDLFWYRYPEDEEMEWAKLKIVFLGYYIKDFNNFANAEFLFFGS